MNLTKHIFSIIFIALFVTNCDGILNQEPKSSLSSEQFYETEEDAIAASNDLYNTFASPVNGREELELTLGEVLSDQSDTEDFSTIPTVELVNYTFDSDNGNITAYWMSAYQVINRANNILSQIPEIEMNPSLKERILGEARFFRAMGYFNLVKSFGGVPLVLEPTTSTDNLEIPRSSEDEIYQQVIDDLTLAIDDLPESYDSEDYGRVTKWGALGVLSRVYLYHQEWPNAANTALQVIQSNQFSLFEDYADKWKLENETGDEFIFSIQYSDEVLEIGRVSQFTMPRNQGIGGIGNFGVVTVRQSFYDSYADHDARKTAAYRTSYNFPDGRTISFTPHTWKYYPEAAKNYLSNKNFPIVGYDEILLTYAEALNEVQGPGPDAYDAINQVRNRVNLDDLENLSQAEFRKAVWQERSWELAFEGHRTWDLMRTDQLVEVMQDIGVNNVSSKHSRLPIPRRELDSNKNLEQNPGW